MGREYGRKTYMSKDYNSMMRTTTDKSINDQVLQKHSEFKKPYTGDQSYQEMENDYAPPGGQTPPTVTAGII